MLKPEQEIYLRDLRLSTTSKWVPASIVKILGPVDYEINVDGCTRQALIDHLKPRPVTKSQREELTLINGAPGCDVDDPIPLVVSMKRSLKKLWIQYPQQTVHYVPRETIDHHVG